VSYNVDNAAILTGQLWLSREGREWLDRRSLVREPKEDSALPERRPRYGDIQRDDLARITHFTWGGENSGNAVECGAFRKLLSFTKGTADILLTWEGGDSFSGYRVVDGVVTRHMVEMTLGEEIDE